MELNERGILKALWSTSQDYARGTIPPWIWWRKKRKEKRVVIHPYFWCQASQSAPCDNRHKLGKFYRKNQSTCFTRQTLCRRRQSAGWWDCTLAAGWGLWLVRIRLRIRVRCRFGFIKGLKNRGGIRRPCGSWRVVYLNYIKEKK